MTQNANDITIANTSPASDVTLTSGGGAQSLVVDGIGPTLSVRGLTPGTGGISIWPGGAVVYIDNTLTGASLGGTAAVFANKAGAMLNMRGITAGTGLTVTQNANDISIGVSVRPYASMSFNGNEDITTAVNSVYGPIITSYDSGLSNSFTRSGGILTYTGATTRSFLVSYQGSVQLSAHTNRSLIFAMIRTRAGSGSPMGFQAVFMEKVAQIYGFGMSDTISLVPNDTIQVQVMGFGDTSDINVYGMYVNVSAVD